MENLRFRISLQTALWFELRQLIKVDKNSQQNKIYFLWLVFLFFASSATSYVYCFSFSESDKNVLPNLLVGSLLRSEATSNPPHTRTDVGLLMQGYGNTRRKSQE